MKVENQANVVFPRKSLEEEERKGPLEYFMSPPLRQESGQLESFVPAP